MRILLLAPHPFYQERGTPIAVNQILRVLATRGDAVDVLTFHEGQDLHYKNVSVFRTPSLFFVRGIRLGFSWKKLVCDWLMLIMTVRLVIKNRYHVVHAVEEAVFIALLVKWAFGIPYVYDMDSSLAQQMIEKYSWLSRIAFILNSLERVAIQHARAVVPVCEALAKIATSHHQQNVVILHDVPLADEQAKRKKMNLKGQLGVGGLLVMYVGNLEHFQGIGLLLESFAFVLERARDAHLVIIGGEQQDIQQFSAIAEDMKIARRVNFLGPKPVGDLAAYLREADVLVSPRIKGNNTPMKVYSYLQSGVPVVATDLVTHTQVLNSSVARLAPPTAQEFSLGILQLLNDPPLRDRLGKSAQRWVRDHFSYEAFSKKVNTLYDWLTEGGTQPLSVFSPFLPSPTS